MGDDEIVEYLYNKLESDRYWIIIGLPDDKRVVMMFTKIEEEFFPPRTSLNKEFELVTGPRFNIGIFTKKRIGVDDLKFITGYEMTEKQPMLLPTNIENGPKVQKLGDWIMNHFNKIAQKRNSS
ncbi:MAG: hypothetical protein KGI05_00370 [Thaumarchaeota archaeon]|nr:hypothetical protein [Nitrososphaerota archaeon]